MKHLIIAGAVVAALVGFSQAEAKTVRLTWGKITNTIVNDGNIYGGCMAFVNFDIRKYASSCSTGASGGSYVAFSCNGALQDSEVGKTLFEQAQIAHLMNKEIRFEVDDAKKHNGFCLVTRADIR